MFLQWKHARDGSIISRRRMTFDPVTAKTIGTQACTYCRAGKVKCIPTKAQCQRCKTLGRECTYDTIDHKIPRYSGRSSRGNDPGFSSAGESQRRLQYSKSSASGPAKPAQEGLSGSHDSVVVHPDTQVDNNIASSHMDGTLQDEHLYFNDDHAGDGNENGHPAPMSLDPSTTHNPEFETASLSGLASLGSLHFTTEERERLWDDFLQQMETSTSSPAEDLLQLRDDDGVSSRIPTISTAEESFKDGAELGPDLRAGHPAVTVVSREVQWSTPVPVEPGVLASTSFEQPPISSATATNTICTCLQRLVILVENFESVMDNGIASLDSALASHKDALSHGFRMAKCACCTTNIENMTILTFLVDKMARVCRCIASACSRSLAPSGRESDQQLEAQRGGLSDINVGDYSVDSKDEYAVIMHSLLCYNLRRLSELTRNLRDIAIQLRSHTMSRRLARCEEITDGILDKSP